MHQQQLASNKGQSLLEVVILIGLALIIVTGLTIVTINGLKNSQFSQNQAQATRLAQDAIDCIRSIKDQNKPITNGGTTYYWYDASTANPDIIWNTSIDPAKSFKILANCGGLQDAVTDSSIPTTLQGTFTRNITIRDYCNPGCNATKKQIAVLVQWTDISGTHQSSLATIIGQDQ